MSAIRVQRSLITMELGTGSMYGDESDTSRGSLWGKKKSTPTSPDIEEDDGNLEEDLAKQMSGLMSGDSEEEPAQEGPAQESESKPESTPPEEDEVSLGANDDFDSFLLNMAEEPETPVPARGPKKGSLRPIPKEDPDVETFLEGDEFSDFLDSI